MTVSDFLTRARRRGGRLLRELIPYNGQYRPVGVHASAAEAALKPDLGLTYHAIEAAHASELVIPPAFYEQASDLRGHNRRPDSHETVEEAFALEIRQGRVYADNWESVAIMSADNYLLGDVSFSHSAKEWLMQGGEANNIFEQRYFEPPIHLPGTVCTLLSGGGAAMGNYYHWLIDSLPRLHLVFEAGLAGHIDYYLVYDRHNGFVMESLLALGIKPEQIIDVETHRHLTADRLIATSPVRGHSGRHTPVWACEFLRKAYLPVAQRQGQQFGPLVYITRRDASFRRLRNEAALEPWLREQGFEIHALSDLSFIDKVALFAGARLLVGPMGAGMSNVVFSAPGTPLFEMLPDCFAMSEDLELTYRLGLPYYWLTCPTNCKSMTSQEVRYANLTVDEELFKELTSQLLEQFAPVNQPAETV